MIKRLFLLVSTFISVVVNAQTHVYIIGDSTTEIWKSPKWYPCMGWGARLQYFFDSEKVIVDDRAVGGRSSQTFYDRHWPEVLADLESGDYLFVCFGANDSNKNAYAYVTLDDFHMYIGKYCEEAREKGAIPVLLSTINANAWGSSGYRNNTYGTYPQAMEKAAIAYETPFIDLNTFGAEISMMVGKEYNTYYRYNNYYPGEYPNYPDGIKDNIHLQETGAIDFCRYITEEIENSSDDRLQLLADATKPRYMVTFDADNDSMYTSISRSATFPEGINVTLKSYGVDSTKSCQWINENGEIVSDSNIHVYVMEDHEEHFTALYNTTPVSQISSDNFKILSDRIIFFDNQKHTLNIRTFEGRLVTSVSTQSCHPFCLPTGVYVLTIDGTKSTKIMIK